MATWAQSAKSLSSQGFVVDVLEKRDVNFGFLGWTSSVKVAIGIFKDEYLCRLLQFADADQDGKSKAAKIYTVLDVKKSSSTAHEEITLKLRNGTEVRLTLRARASPSARVINPSLSRPIQTEARRAHLQDQGEDGGHVGCRHQARALARGQESGVLRAAQP